MNNYLPTEIQIKLREDERLKAIVTLKFGIITIKGFRVQVSDKSESGYWVTPPAIFNIGSKKWHPIFFIEDKEIWQKIEEMILTEMDNKLSENITVNDIENIMNS